MIISLSSVSHGDDNSRCKMICYNWRLHIHTITQHTYLFYSKQVFQFRPHLFTPQLSTRSFFHSITTYVHPMHWSQCKAEHISGDYIWWYSQKPPFSESWRIKNWQYTVVLCNSKYTEINLINLTKISNFNSMQNFQAIRYCIII